MTTEACCSVGDVANHLGVVKDSGCRGIETRNPPAHTIGRLWKFQLSTADERQESGAANWNRRARDAGPLNCAALDPEVLMALHERLNTLGVATTDAGGGH